MPVWEVSAGSTQHGEGRDERTCERPEGTASGEAIRLPVHPHRSASRDQREAGSTTPCPPGLCPAPQVLATVCLQIVETRAPSGGGVTQGPIGSSAKPVASGKQESLGDPKVSLRG